MRIRRLKTREQKTIDREILPPLPSDDKIPMKLTYNLIRYHNMNKSITIKQQQCLVLWAQNYSHREIAKKLKKSPSTIRDRLKAVKHTEAYENALAIRNSYKKAKHNLEHIVSLSNLNTDKLTIHSLSE